MHDDKHNKSQQEPHYTTWKEGFIRGIYVAIITGFFALIIIAILTAISPYR